jgi:hypothetical protein
MHLVDVLGPVDAAADEDEAASVEHREADAGPIGERFEGRHAITFQRDRKLRVPHA